jgi:predicted metal-dependent peptidase
MKHGIEHLVESDVRQLYADPALAARQARDKLASARVWLMRHKPFFGVLARALRLEASLEVPAFRLGADDRVLFHPMVVLGLRLPALCARLAHLSLHAALGAHGRRRDRDPRRWNAAHDLAIAALLEAAELAIGTAPRTVAELGELPAGASAESYYELLPPGSVPEPAWCDLCDALPEAEAPPAGTFTRRDGDDESSDEGEASGASGGDEAPQGPVASQRPAASATHELAPVPSASERGHELLWKMRLAAAFEEELASGGKTFGEVPAWLDELVRATIEPPADWTVVLQHAVSSLRRSGRSFLRPSRRMSALCDANGEWPDTVTMPGRRIEQAGQLVVVIDTSASVSSAVLARFLGAVASVATAEGIDDVRLMQADAAVTSDEMLHSAELLFKAIAIAGRGGTDFAPALEELEREARRAAQRFTVIYLTDLDGRFPAASAVAALDVLWVVPAEVRRVPPFGRLATMKTDSREM